MSKDITCLALPPDLLGPWAYQHGDSPVSWAKSDVEKQALTEINDLIIILSGENIRRFSLELPSLRGQELRAATEFELEDHIGGSLTDEIICQNRKFPGQVALLSESLRDKLGQILRDYSLTPSQILIDYDVLGSGQNAQIGERLLKGGPQGFAIHSDWADLIKDAPVFDPISPQALFTHFKKGVAQDSALDLRASLKLKDASTAPWQRWAKLAALAAGVIILPFMLDYYAKARAWTQQADEDNRAAAALYTQATGETVNNAARKVAQQLKSGQSSTGFLDMTAALITSISSVDGVEIDSLRYDPRQNMLQLTLRYPSFEAGAALEQAVSQNGGRLVVGGIRERGEALIGEASLSLTQGGSQ